MKHDTGFGERVKIKDAVQPESELMLLLVFSFRF